MRVGCPACKAAYDVDDAQVPPGGLELQCSSCGGAFVAAHAAAPPPVPLPGAPHRADDAGAIPLPGTATLPPPAAPAAAPAPPAMPPPAPAAPPPPPPRTDAVPLPGTAAPAAEDGSVPLPPPPDFFGSLDLGDLGTTPAPGAAVDELDFGDGDLGFSEPTPGGGYDPAAPIAGTPPPGSDRFAAAPPPPATPGFDPFAAPPPPPAAPDTPPPPPPDPIGGDAFASPPMSPLSPESLFGDEPPPAGASTGDLEPGGEPLPDLDLTLPPLVEAPGASATAQATAELLRDFLLEDETPPAAPEPQPTPPPRPAGGPPPPMFHVRRKSGKRIGPFDEETLVRLVRQDQLDGSEDISEDGEAWSPLSDVPEVATLLKNRPQRPRVPPHVAPVLQRGIVVEEPVLAPLAEPAVVEAAEAEKEGRLKLPFAVSRKLAIAVGGGIAGVVLLVAGALLFLGGEPAPPEEDPAQAAAAEAAKLAQKARREQRAVVKKDLDAAAAAFRRGETEEAARLVAGALEGASLQLLDKKDRAAGYLLQGEIALRERRIADAEKAYRAAVGEGSDEARIALGRFLLARHRAADVVEVLKAKAEDAATSVLLVEAHLMAGGVPAAESYLQPLEKKRAKGVPLQLLRGLVLRRAGKFSEAAAAIEKAVAAEPDRGAAQVALVSLQLEMGRPSDVEAAVERIDSIFAAFDAAGGLVNEDAPAGEEPARPREGEAGGTSGDAPAAAIVEAGEAPAPSGEAAEVPAGEGAVAEAPKAVAGQPEAGKAEEKAASSADAANAKQAEKAEKEKQAKPKRVAFDRFELARLQYLLGFHLVEKGETEEALAAFERAAALDPDADEVPAGRGHLRWKAGDPEGAKALFEEALAINDSSPEALAGLGRIAAANEEWEDALEKLSRARDLAPTDPAFAMDLARAQLAAGNSADALRTIDSLFDRRDDLADAHGIRADVLLARKDLMGAESEARKAIALAKDEVRFHLQLARIREKAGTLAPALAAWRDALALAPGNPDALEGQGRTLLAMGATLDGVKSLEAALEKDPERTRLLEAIADGYLRSRRFKQAIDAIERQQRLTGAKGLSFKLARALQEQGRTDLAIAQFQKAIAEDPDDALAHRFLGFAYKDKNQIRKAVEAFQTYLSKAPDADDRAEIEDEIATLRF
ncbi:MAG TPA: tetratricopeptide repeat protein [Vulgatibacter sp.]|nr:tetratricopeptide repeat protein [Vulgatibacter sp.]